MVRSYHNANPSPLAGGLGINRIADIIQKVTKRIASWVSSKLSGVFTILDRTNVCYTVNVLSQTRTTSKCVVGRPMCKSIEMCLQTATAYLWEKWERGVFEITESAKIAMSVQERGKHTKRLTRNHNLCEMFCRTSQTWDVKRSEHTYVTSLNYAQCPANAATLDQQLLPQPSWSSERCSTKLEAARTDAKILPIKVCKAQNRGTENRSFLKIETTERSSH